MGNSGIISVYSRTFSMRSGLGPTIDISPRNILISCGNSSNRNGRIIFPTKVILLSFSIALRAEILSASTTIERNLRTLKERFPSVTRSCLNKTGPPSYSLTAKAMRSISGDAMTRAMLESKMSNKRFTIFCSAVSPLFRQ